MTAKTIEQITAEKVARGAALLDKVVPDWPQRLADKNITVSDPRNCVLYHIFGDYLNGKSAVGLGMFGGSVENGFCGGASVDNAWRDLITTRLASPPPVVQPTLLETVLAMFI